MRRPRPFHRRHVATLGECEGEWAYFRCTKCRKTCAVPAERIENGWHYDRLPKGWRKA